MGARATREDECVAKSRTKGPRSPDEPSKTRLDPRVDPASLRPPREDATKGPAGKPKITFRAEPDPTHALVLERDVRLAAQAAATDLAHRRIAELESEVAKLSALLEEARAQKALDDAASHDVTELRRALAHESQRHAALAEALKRLLEEERNLNITCRDAERVLKDLPRPPPLPTAAAAPQLVSPTSPARAPLESLPAIEITDLEAEAATRSE